jgi:5S rRNA maturation endonuclease (ribonuclease M5)
MTKLNKISPAQVLRYFEARCCGVRRGREHEYVAHCPLHDDSTPSFSFNVEKRVWKCHAECGGGTLLQLEQLINGSDVREALKNIGEIIGEELAFAPQRKQNSEEVFDYTDAQNNLLFQVVRTDLPNGAGKKFTQRRMGENGGWIYNLDGVRKVLYRLPEVITAKEVFIVEGEKKADRLRAALAETGVKDIAVTCNPGGAGKWQDADSGYLMGRKVVILPDSDKVGHKHSEQVAAYVNDYAVGIKIVQLSGLPESGDIADFLDCGGTIQQLVDKVEVTPLWKAETEGEPVDGAALLNDVSAFISRYVSLTQAQADVNALWDLHTHALDAADYTPYSNISSADKRSGKTRLLEVQNLLVAKPWLTSRTTTSALVRKIANDQPTLLLDESDAAFKGNPDYAEALRGILNSGFEREGKVSLSVPVGKEWEMRDFSTFSPKAIAGILSRQKVDGKGPMEAGIMAAGHRLCGLLVITAAINSNRYSPNVVALSVCR